MMMIVTAGMLFVILLLPSILSDVCDPCISILREHSDQETKPYQFIYLFNAKWMRLFVFHSESFLSTDGLSDELTGEYRWVQGTCPGDLWLAVQTSGHSRQSLSLRLLLPQDGGLGAGECLVLHSWQLLQLQPGVSGRVNIHPQSYNHRATSATDNWSAK